MESSAAGHAPVEQRHFTANSHPQSRSVSMAISRVGRPGADSHPHSVNYAEIQMALKPLGDWRAYQGKAELVEAVGAALRPFPGVQLNFARPIRNAFDELLSGDAFRHPRGLRVERGARVTSRERGAEDVENLAQGGRRLVGDPAFDGHVAAISKEMASPLTRPRPRSGIARRPSRDMPQRNAT